MTPFRRDADHLVADFSPTERMLLTRLAEDLQSLLRDSRSAEGEGDDGATTGEAADPALARLAPDAYPDDAEASAEFRRFTEPELLDRKAAQQRTIVRLFGDGSDADDGPESADPTASIALTEPDALALLRGLTDLRLVIAERLGIRNDGDDGMPMPGDEFTANVYAWLGYLQGSLIEALDA